MQNHADSTENVHNVPQHRPILHVGNIKLRGCGRKVGRVSVRIGVRCVQRGVKAESRRHVLPGRHDVEEGDRRAGVPI